MNGCPKTIQTMETFFLRFHELANKKLTAEIEKMSSFFRDFEAMIMASSLYENFNLLDITSVGSDEVKHSGILAWLFSPTASHACGQRFLCSFLKAANIPISEKDIKKCNVKTEFSGSEAIIDIIIYQPGVFLVYVENKIFAPEGVDQLNREYRDMVRIGESIRIPHEKMYPVFLTPNGRAPVTGDSNKWISLSYFNLAQELMTLIPELQGNKIAYLLEDLVEHYNSWSVI